MIGFPVLATVALDRGASSSHAAVVIGLLPAATATVATLRAGERPATAFWLASGAGAVAVTLFAVIRQEAVSGGLAVADLLLFGALVAGGVGYAEGGRLARTMPGWRIIAWALVLTLPGTAITSAGLLAATPVRVSGDAFLGFAYVALVSMFLGFFAWYRGLADAGVARASQLQVAQPLLTVGWSAWLLGERVGPPTVVAAVAVLVCVGLTQRAGVRTRQVTRGRRRRGRRWPPASRAAGPCAPGPIRPVGQVRGNRPRRW